MSHVSIEKTNNGFDYWLSRPFLEQATRERLKHADVILVPQEGFRGKELPVFPVCTEEVFQFVSEELSGKLSVDIAIEDDEYKELALHSALLIISGFVVTALAAPLLVNVVSEYINRKLFKDSSSTPVDTNVRFEITVEERVGNNSKRIQCKYDGPANLFADTMKETLEIELPKLRQDTPRIAGPQTDAKS